MVTKHCSEANLETDKKRHPAETDWLVTGVSNASSPSIGICRAGTQKKDRNHPGYG